MISEILSVQLIPVIGIVLKTFLGRDKFPLHSDQTFFRILILDYRQLVKNNEPIPKVRPLKISPRASYSIFQCQAFSVDVLKPLYTDITRGI